MTEILITRVRPYGEECVDIRIVGEKIAEIGTSLEAGNALVVNGQERVALPSFVDLHTHLREPGREDAETIATGSRAAAKGGFSAVFAMANTSPVADTAGVV